MDCVVGNALVIKILRVDDLRVVQSQGYRVLLLARIAPSIASNYLICTWHTK